ncbi:type II toxin-antitoxin system VapC family toxin [Gemmatimonas groenlandica]|uniref:Type II toxin-antitoxin system VapC family toxin n=1 Tax=Gemmatimonas groenlandica TaxID=2732249 RepID=A0A6M4IKJ1_9BACT|nr:type II toxin-antitoxin system VapC family toxin [Gemmatimonas groenlandica]QJR34037.1 type II toxin-antitoxin system VapC family toxin [Gemmatimonas groenlandica]
MSRVVLDTSALLFWTLAPERLSERARAAIDAAAPFGWMASAISLWEIGLKEQRGQLSLGVTFTEYVQRLQLVDGLVLAPVDVRTWLRTLDLDWAHRDPADRVIVATAELHSLPLITSDAEMGRYYPDVVW